MADAAGVHYTINFLPLAQAAQKYLLADPNPQPELDYLKKLVIAEEA
jgi:hypothetical protein